MRLLPERKRMRHLMVTSMVLAALLVPGGTLAAGQEPPETGDFAEAGSMEQARVNHTASLLADGRVLIVGGQSDFDLEVYVATAETWDPVTGSFSPAGKLSQARGSHTATRLRDGRVLVVGGYDGHSLVQAAEIWDPSTASFGSAGSLEPGRIDHVATLSSDGRVLVVGGEREGCCRDSVPASAQVWDPDTETFSATRWPDRGRESRRRDPLGSLCPVGARAVTSRMACRSLGSGPRRCDPAIGHSPTEGGRLDQRNEFDVPSAVLASLDGDDPGWACKEPTPCGHIPRFAAHEGVPGLTVLDECSLSIPAGDVP
jgi:hypothetical protein